MNSKVKNSVVKVKSFSDPMIIVRLYGEEKDLVIIQVYMPTIQHSEKEIDELYEIVKEIIEKTKGACVIIKGDYNVVIGEGKHKNIVENYNLGNRNDRATKLIEICKRKGLAIRNTMYQHHKGKLFFFVQEGKHLQKKRRSLEAPRQCET